MATTETAAARSVELERKPEHVFAVFIRASREQVWEAITSSDYTLKYYYASTVESQFRPGAPIVYRIDGNDAIRGEVIESAPPEKLVTTFDAVWDDEVRADPPSRLTWILDEAGEGVTKLTVVHDGFASESSTFNQVAGGMPFILSGLKTLLETGEPLMPSAR